MSHRFQKGSVKLVGAKTKTWYGWFRRDVPNGKRVQVKIRIGTLAEYPSKNSAQIALMNLMGSSHTEKCESPKSVLTFEELTNQWKVAEGAEKKSTSMFRYKEVIRLYLVPAFGPRKIDSINRTEIREFFSSKAPHFGESSLKLMRTVLRAVFSYAVMEGHLLYSPCEKIKLPGKTGGRKLRRNALTPDQVKAIVEGLCEPYSTLVVFLFSTGLRIGEAAALKWEDVGPDVLHVRHRIANGELDSPKTRNSVRDIPISPELRDRLKTLGGNEWVFRSRAGTPIDSKNSLRRYVHPAATKAGIKLSGWHDFRHSFATHLSRSDVSPKLIAASLGHKSVAFTLDTYTQVNISELREPLERMAAVL